MFLEQFEIGDGIVLTEVQPGDADELYRLVAQNRDHLRHWMPWADTTESVNDTLAFVESAQEQHADGRGFQCCIRLDGRIVGVVGHVNINRVHMKTELGYWISQEYQGRGIVTKAVRTLVDHAFSELSLNRVEIQAGEANVRSRAVAERLGFQLEGMLRESLRVNDHYVSHAVYGMLKRDWRSRKDEEER